MELTKAALEFLIEPISDMVAEMLREEILEAQKYRIDREFELKTREQNLQFPNYCPQCNKFTNEVAKLVKDINDSTHCRKAYFCSCGLQLGYQK